MVELLAPVGNWVMLRAAVSSGCDAVYFGTKFLNMRATAKSFELNELSKVVSYCHENNVKAYLTMNVVVYENELDKVYEVLKIAKNAGIDAIICWDLAVIEVCKELGLEFHISTQASVSNSSAVKFYADLGATRVVLARECTLEMIKEIYSKSDVEIEAFIHGAMCVSVSGRCFLSQFMYGKSANRGECVQPCRREYDVIDTETGKELKVNNHFIMSPKDLCTVEIIDKLIESGISVFKIEGRNRSPEYVQTVVSVYRKLIDAFNSGKLTDKMKKESVEELKEVYNKKFSTGFYLGTPTNDDYTDIYGSAATVKKVYVGVVVNYFNKVSVAEIKVETNGLQIGDELMIQGPTTGVIKQKIETMEIDNKKITSIKKGSVGIKLPLVRPNDKVFILIQ